MITFEGKLTCDTLSCTATTPITITAELTRDPKTGEDHPVGLTFVTPNGWVYQRRSWRDNYHCSAHRPGPLR